MQSDPFSKDLADLPYSHAEPRQERRNPVLRARIDQALAKQDRSWLTGRAGGRSWALSRSKRLASALLALLALLLLSPLLVLVAVLIKTHDPGPIFFVQERTGFRGRRFGMYKFRTMVANAEALKSSVQHLNKHGADAIDFKVDRDPRITPVGRWLRRTSIDELPNLLNVIRGDMRLVGPRPTSFKADTYLPRHLVRLSIYPGITGLWQVSGRSDLGFDDRVQLDMQYIEQQSPWFDLRILLKTPLKILDGQGAS
ncbi:sugar transferase [Pseudomonas oryzihabitans]|uniref:sugar transferase n=1 Tax=Pseudomonas oryzihabitans TaxID=47885 RepID=UPI00135D6314|nr:sugar transferase [Pseudomonas oryzihabitans]MXS21664.1 sugar transferase [Pseudomonas oryzihabitans]